jgi:hypothetical protein
MAQQVPRIDLEEGVEEVPMGFVAQEAGEQRNRGAMRWTSAMSSFVLRRMCQLIETGVRTDKDFKEVHLNRLQSTCLSLLGWK